MEDAKPSAARAVGPILLLALAGACAAPEPEAREETPPAIEELAREVDLAWVRGEALNALELAEALYERLHPLHLDALYDLACINATLGRAPETHDWLTRAVNEGYWDVAELRREPAFAELQGEAWFERLVDRARHERYVAMLERPERDAYQKPEEVMAALAFAPGERVADIGAGSGYFTLRIARAVGPTGVVHALDVSQEMLDHLAERVEVEKLDNVTLERVAEDDPRLPDASVDTILLVDTWHHIRSRTSYARRLRAALAPGGRLVLIDYIPKSRAERSFGPAPEHLLERELVDTELAAAGFAPLREHHFLPEHYFVEYGPE